MKLVHKLTGAFLLVSLIAIGLAAAIIWGVSSFEFNRYLQDQRQQSFVEATRLYYEQHGVWSGIDRAIQPEGDLLKPPAAGDKQPPHLPFALLDQNRRIVVPGGAYQRGQQVPAGRADSETPVVVDGIQVGAVINTGQPLVKNAGEQQFNDRINQALLAAALGGVLISLFLGFFLARTLTRPVNELISATRAMARGKLGQRVPVRSSDELGELAVSFNQMSADLASANQSRRQMTADIAHDLRNPLTVIAGYLESLSDGVLKPTPERFDAMQSEVQHLERLVEDLRTLSLADAGELILYRQPVSPHDLLERAALAYQHQADLQNVVLRVAGAADLPEVNLDAERIEQVLGNLLSNALRYTPQDGEISLSAGQAPGGILFIVQDNGAGIAPEDLPHIFERSYRGDASRQGSEFGLGLSIVRSIIELHGGTISAASAGPGTGAQFQIFFPV